MEVDSGETTTDQRRNSTDSIDKELDWLIESHEGGKEVPNQEDKQAKDQLENEKADDHDDQDDDPPRVNGNEPDAPHNNEIKQQSTPSNNTDPDDMDVESGRKSPSSPRERRSSSDGEDYSDQESYELSADQRQAMMELHNMKLDLAYTDDEAPPDYDVTERVRQLNEELAKDPPPEDERERSIKFKDNLVDLVAPPVDYSESEEENADQRKEAERTGDVSGESENSPSAQQGSEQGASSEESEQSPNKGQEEDEKILVERNGKFELISAKDLSPEEREMYGVEGPSSSTSQVNHSPHPPPGPRPATANGAPARGRSQQPGNGSNRRRAQSAQSADPGPRGSEFDAKNFDYVSPYALSEDDKKQLARQKRLQQQQEKQHKKENSEEEKRKKEESDSAFQCWLRKKRDDAAQRRRCEQQHRRKEEEEKASNVSDEENEERNPDGAFQEWLKVKKQQKKKETEEERKKQKEIDEGWYERPRNQCNQAFREWLKKKNQEIIKAHREEKQKARIHKLLARRSHKSLALARAIKQSQSFRYVDYYGYRF